MKLVLKLLFGFMFIFMVVMTIRTGLQQSLWDAWHSFAASPWSMATLYDCYFAFLTVYCWVAWREVSTASRVIWFVLIMALGSIAISAYVLIQLFQLGPGDDVSPLFRRKSA